MNYFIVIDIVAYSDEAEVREVENADDAPTKFADAIAEVVTDYAAFEGNFADLTLNFIDNFSLEPDANADAEYTTVATFRGTGLATFAIVTLKARKNRFEFFK